MIRRARGFTIIELMIVVAIVGILAAIAYPAYTDSRRKSARAEAKALMADVASRLAPYHSDNATYTTDLTALGFPAGALKTKSGRHTIAIGVVGTNPIATTYRITATPTAGTDPSCSPLTFNHLGVMEPAGC